MAWNKREGLNVLSSKNDFIEHTSYNQNTLAKISLARVLATTLGGAGLYRQDGSSAIDVSQVSAGTKVPPLNLLIADTLDELWCFSTEVQTSITFNDANTNPGSLYAVIDLINPAPVGGDAAIASYSDVSFVAQASATAAPDNSVLIGTGEISSSAFVDFTESNLITFPPALSILLWRLTTDLGITTQDIEDSDTLFFEDDNGVENSVQNGNLITKYILQSSSGLQVDNNQLAIKAKSGSTIFTDNDGVYRTITESDTFVFNISGNLGSPQLISKNDTLKIIGTNSISTSSISDTIQVDLNLLSSGGLEIDTNQLKVKLAGSGRLTSGSAGLARDLAEFILKGSAGTQDTFNEDETINVLGSNAIQIKSENDNKLNINLKLSNATENSYESGLKIVNSTLSIALDPQSNIESSVDGIYVAKRSPAAKYGYPDTGTYSVGDLFTDKSGANWKCTTAGNGLSAKWLQITVGKSYEASGTPNLPLATEFYGGYRPHSYRILSYDNTTSKVGRVWMWFNWGRENDYEIGFWVSESLYELSWNQDIAWIEGTRDDLFDIKGYTYYTDYRLNLYNPYDGYLVDRTKLSICGEGFSGVANFYHQDVDLKYYDVSFTASGSTYDTYDVQGRAFKKTASRYSLLSVVATNTDVSTLNNNAGLKSDFGIKSTIRYIVDQDATLFDG